MGWCDIEPAHGHVGSANRGHADGLRTLGSLLDLKLDTLVFLERPKAAAADLGEVDEDILGPIVRSDKAEALVTVEPLHSSLHHLLTSLIQSGRTKTSARTLTGLMMDKKSRALGRSFPSGGFVTDQI
jgi:hypothetical protein